MLLLGSEWTPWILMWALAFSVYAGLKWLTFADATETGRVSDWRSLGYLMLWPGMDAKTFLTAAHAVPRPSATDWLWAFGKVAFGLMLIFAFVPVAFERHRLLAGWIGMAGMVLVVHFGLFHMLSLAWQRAGVNAPPIMDIPILASSLSEFWGRRWNLAFRDLAHTYVFRPFVRRLGVARATMAVFLTSGAVHDFVISVPSRAGFGLPTLYFAIQGLGLLIERSRWGIRLGWAGSVVGRGFCAVVTLAPVGLLFHRHFVEQVVIPMLTAFRAI